MEILKVTLLASILLSSSCASTKTQKIVQHIEVVKINSIRYKLHRYPFIKKEGKFAKVNNGFYRSGYVVVREGKVFVMQKDEYRTLLKRKK